MMKYPIGMQSFDQIVEGGFVYVDKTALVHRLATTGKIYFLSRPRRFGKSLLLSTLKNYFLGRRELFRGLAVEKPLPMIYQSGYLTIKNFNSRRGTFLLDFPNDEVKKGFVALLAAEYLKPQGESMNSWILNVVDALEGGRPDELCRLFTTFLAETPYSMRRNNDERERERYFHYTLYLIFRLVSVYTVYTERQLSGGRADCVVETPRFVYVFEFKLDGSAAEALRQIDERGYALPYAGGGRPVFRIGASFSSTTGTIAEWETRRGLLRGRRAAAQPSCGPAAQGAFSGSTCMLMSVPRPKRARSRSSMAAVARWASRSGRSPSMRMCTSMA